MSKWTPYTEEYKPLAAGSIDGTDKEPHDRGIVRAMHANYVPPDVDTKAEYTLFVGRLPYNLGEDKLQEKFSRFGKLKNVRVIRDLVTGQSKGYGFVEFCHRNDATDAMRESRGLEIDGYRVIVDRAAGHKLKGWVPRRLGGGWGGRKEAGQLRFGCVERPWKKPIIIQPKHSDTSSNQNFNDRSSRSSMSLTRDIERDKGRSCDGERGQYSKYSSEKRDHKRGRYKDNEDRDRYSDHQDSERYRDHQDIERYRDNQKREKVSHHSREKLRDNGDRETRRDHQERERLRDHHRRDYDGRQNEKTHPHDRPYEKDSYSRSYSERKHDKYGGNDRQTNEDKFE